MCRCVQDRRVARIATLVVHMVLGMGGFCIGLCISFSVCSLIMLIIRYVAMCVGSCVWMVWQNMQDEYCR